MPVTTNTRKLAALLGASGAGIGTDGLMQPAGIDADMATQAELDASGIDGVSSSGATASDTITITGNLKVKGAFMKTTHHSWVMGG